MKNLKLFSLVLSLCVFSSFCIAMNDSDLMEISDPSLMLNSEAISLKRRAKQLKDRLESPRAARQLSIIKDEVEQTAEEAEELIKQAIDNKYIGISHSLLKDITSILNSIFRKIEILEGARPKETITRKRLFQD